MSVEILPLEVLQLALSRLVRSSRFLEKNGHLSSDELTGLLSSLIIWPKSPVFSPYATTHDGYSQGLSSCYPDARLLPLSNTREVRIAGIKYLTHRVTYQAFHCDLQPELDISHTVYIGSRTNRLVYPHLIIHEAMVFSPTTLKGNH